MLPRWMQHYMSVGSDSEKDCRAPAVLVLGTVDPVAQGLVDQTLPAAEVLSVHDANLAERIGATQATTLVFLHPAHALAPDALLCGSRALDGGSAAAVIARAEGLDDQGIPIETTPGWQDEVDFLAGWARGIPFAAAQAFVCRDRVQSVLRKDAGMSPEEVIASVVTSYTTVFLDEVLVRCSGGLPVAAFPDAVFRGNLLETLCFRLGGGRWANCAARAQVRREFAEARASGDPVAPLVMELRQAADLLTGQPTVFSGSETVRSFSSTPAPALPLLPAPVAEGWDAGRWMVAGEQAALVARRARASSLARVEEAGVALEAQSRWLAGRARGEGCPAEDPGAIESRIAAALPPREQGERSLCVALEVPALSHGGLENVVASLARNLRSAGFRTLVICDDRGGALAEELAADGIDVFVLGEPDREGELAVLLSDQQVDVLSAHYSWLGIPAAAAQDIPVVMTVHNEYGWMGAGAQEAVRALDPLVHGYVAVSQTVADFHAARFSIDPGRIAVVRNAVHRLGEAPSPLGRQEARGRLGLSSEAFTLLLVGRIDPVKGQILLADAVAHCAGRGLVCEVLLAGGIADPIYAAQLEHRLAELSLTAHFRILGERLDVPDLLAAADLFVQPSMFEGLSLAAVEALQAGVPAVLAPTGDATFLLGEGREPRAGIVYERPPHDPRGTFSEIQFRAAAQPAAAEVQALAAAIREAAENIEDLRVGARRRAETLRASLATERMVSEHAACLRAAVAASSVLNLEEFERRLLAEHGVLAAEIRKARESLPASGGLWEGIRRRFKQVF